MATNGYGVIDCTPYHPFANNSTFEISKETFEHVKALHDMQKPIILKNVDYTSAAYGSVYKVSDTSFKVGVNARSNNGIINYLLWFAYDEDESKYVVTCTFTS